MDGIKVIKYSSSEFALWNQFLKNAKNSTFLFNRDFLEYHKDRFLDFSLLIYNRNRLVALVPANRVNATLYSHQGLTYGGLILDKSIKFDKVLKVFSAILKFLEDHGIEELEIKQTPKIYHVLPSDEMDYMLHQIGAINIRKDTLSVIDMNSWWKISANRIEGNKRAEKFGLIVRETEDFESFWETILIPNLKEKHDTSPVHSLAEIKRLKALFPKNIRQFNVYKQGEIVAGTTIFESELVAHSQYISGNDQNNKIGSLDILHFYLINSVFKDKKYFDFGSSNENKGKNINQGLQFWKEGFGARTVIQDFYSVPTRNYKLLDQIYL